MTLRRSPLTPRFCFLLRFLRSSTLKTKYKDIYRPSTGAVMLLAALHTCDQVDTPPPALFSAWSQTFQSESVCVCVW